MNQVVLTTPQTLFKHWQGHRAVTRATLVLFPEDQLFSFQPAPPMRSFAALVSEMIGMIPDTLKGAETGDFSWSGPGDFTSKAALLEAWDANTKLIDEAFERIPETRWTQTVEAFGFTQTLSEFVTYYIENEIHHRAQGYVYLRLLNLEPPFFYPM
jgi:uncharacterized damage-inducible protein DinB